MNNLELKNISDNITTYLSITSDKESIFNFLRDWENKWYSDAISKLKSVSSKHHEGHHS